MRTAICISGQPRFFEKGFECLSKNIIEPNGCDVFVHVWHNPNSKEGRWNTSWTSKEVDAVGIDQRILELYKPKKHLIEPQKEDLAPRPYAYYKSRPNAPVHIQFSMFYSIKAANDLKKEYEKENGFEYDCVIRARFDSGLLDRIDLSEYQEDKVYFTDVLRFQGVFCDFLFFGKSKIIDKVCDVYDNLDEYYHGKVGPLCGENVLMHHLENNGLVRQGLRKSLFLVRDAEFRTKSTFGRFWNAT